jgi:hypothetical protein
MLLSIGPLIGLNAAQHSAGTSRALRRVTVADDCAYRTAHGRSGNRPLRHLLGHRHLFGITLAFGQIDRIL